MLARLQTGVPNIEEVPSTLTREKLMRIFLATIAATFLLIAGLMPASATTAGQALVQKPSYGQANRNGRAGRLASSPPLSRLPLGLAPSSSSPLVVVIFKSN